MLPTRQPSEATQYGTNPAPKTAADLPAIRNVLLLSTNPAASALGERLQNAQEQLEKGIIDNKEHAAQCTTIVAEAQVLRGTRKNTLTNLEYSALHDDVALQRHLQQGATAAAHKQAQSKNAAARGRRNLQNMLPPADTRPAKADTRAALTAPTAAPVAEQATRLATPVKVAAQLSDAAASTLSYSAAVLSSKSLYIRSMMSGATWAASATFNGIDHGLLAKERSTLDLLSDTANFGAGALSMVATSFSHAANLNQTAVNTAATSSNTLWGIAGGLAALSGIKNGYQLACQYRTSALAYTASALQVAGGVANAAAAGVSLRSTATSNGNDAELNRLSSSLWMAGTAFGIAGAVVGGMVESRQQKANQLRSGVGTSPV